MNAVGLLGRGRILGTRSVFSKVLARFSHNIKNNIKDNNNTIKKKGRELTDRERAKVIADDIHRSALRKVQETDPVEWAKGFGKNVVRSFRWIVLITFVINGCFIMFSYGYREHFLEHNPNIGKIVHFIPNLSRPEVDDDDDAADPNHNEDVIQRIKDSKSSLLATDKCEPVKVQDETNASK